MIPNAFLLGLAFATAAPAKNDPPQFTVYSSKSVPLTGPVEKLSPEFGLRFAKPMDEIATGDLVTMHQSGIACPGRPAEPMILLANGDCLRGNVSAGEGLSLTLLAKHGKENPPVKRTIPLPAVRAIWFAKPANPDRDPSDYEWLDAGKKQDTLLLRNGDVIRGSFESISERGTSLRFKPSGDTASNIYAEAVVAAIAFDPSLARMKKPKGAYAKVVTLDGSRMTLPSVSGDAVQLKGTLAAGGELALHWSDIVRLDVLQGKATYLSELTPKQSKVEPFGKVEWPWRADRSVKSLPLKLQTENGEEVFDRGLGTHPKTTLTYDLTKKYRYFETFAGLDCTTGRKGSATLHLFLDGVEIGHPLHIRGVKYGRGERIVASLTGVKELKIVIDYGPGGDVQDDVNLGDARLVE